MKPAVAFEGVTKEFRKQASRYRSLREAIVEGIERAIGRAGDRSSGELFALRDVSFEIHSGTALAIIGPNGAGKTTLLKLTGRITRPTTGRIRLRGRTGALIDIAAGIHPELTGRENIHAYGAMMGLRREEIRRKFDSILAFAEIEAFIDTPVKKYSAGMQARLGFSIALHTEPDILLVDEVLAVGDLPFQRKCQQALAALRRRGITVLFVSHNLGAVETLCEQALYLDKGRMVAFGPTGEVVRRYVNAVNANERAPVYGEGRRWGSGEVSISDVHTLDAAGKPKATFAAGEALRVRIRFRCHERVRHPMVWCVVSNEAGVRLFGASTLAEKLDVLDEDGVAECLFEALPCHVGRYEITVGIQDRELRVLYDRLGWAAHFTVDATTDYVSRYQLSEWMDGLVNVPFRWTVAKPSGAIEQV